jgi:hypothetical protein
MNKHKDLPSSSQAWANEVDAIMEENKHLKEVVRRLCENAGLDFSNPKRGINPTRDIPASTNPVGQKLSSLADVQIYNVADKQVLNWSQKDQKWLPVTLPTSTGGAAIDLPMSYNSSISGYGQIDSPFGYYAYTGTNSGGTSEMWGSNGAYIGAGDWRGDLDNFGYSLIDLSRDGFSRPYIQLSAYDYTAGNFSALTIGSYAVRIDEAYFVLARCTTAGRPTGLGTQSQRRGACVYDTDLGIPIWWNGTTWTNALGTAV